MKYIFLKADQFFRSGFWLRKLENPLSSQIANEAANKFKCYWKVLKRNHANLWMTESFFIHNLHISYHDTFCF